MRSDKLNLVRQRAHCTCDLYTCIFEWVRTAKWILSRESDLFTEENTGPTVKSLAICLKLAPPGEIDFHVMVFLVHLVIRKGLAPQEGWVTENPKCLCWCCLESWSGIFPKVSSKKWPFSTTVYQYQLSASETADLLIMFQGGSCLNHMRKIISSVILVFCKCASVSSIHGSNKMQCQAH